VLTEYEDQTYDPVNRSINLQVNDTNSDADSITDIPMDFSLPRTIAANLNRLDADEDEEEETAEEDEVSVDDSKVPDMLHNRHLLGDPRAFAAFVSGMPSTSTSTPTYLESQLTGASMNSAQAEAAAAARRKNNGLYSLKNYKDHYYKIKTPESGVQFICNGCKFQAKSQITLIRHLWNELGYKEFHCEFEGCNRTFDNEFSRYKHRKFDHSQPNQAGNGGSDPTASMLIPTRPDSGSDLMMANPLMNADRFSPIPPLVPLPTTLPTVMPLAPNVSFNSLASTLLNLGQASSSSPTHAPPPSSTYSLSYLPSAPNLFVPITTSTSLLPPATHHLPLPINSNPLLGHLSTSLTCSPATNSAFIPTMTFSMPPLSTSSPRRHSGSSTTSSTSEPQTTNSNLISMLQAPSVAANSITASQVKTLTLND